MDTNAGADPDVIRRRNRNRAVFRRAYEVFREFSSTSSIRSNDSEQFGMGHATHQILWRSDWVCDFHLAGREVLHGREERIFCLYYMLGLSVRGTMGHLKICSRHAWTDSVRIIEEKVGAEIQRRGLWPLHDRSDRAGYFD